MNSMTSEQRRFHEAISFAQIDKVKIILRKNPSLVQKPLSIDSSAFPPLAIAASANAAAIIRHFVVDLGVDVNTAFRITHDDGFESTFTVLFQATQMNAVAAVEALLELGADPTLGTTTPLMLATQLDHAATLAVLLRYPHWHAVRCRLARRNFKFTKNSN